jgi:deoxyribose-phosphate aldolase
MPQATAPNSAGEYLFKSWRDAARLIDHTLLKPEATREQVLAICSEALRFGFATVCVQPCWAALAVQALRGTDTKVDIPVGFPQGAVLTSVKRFEAAELVKLGVAELDMVLNVSMLKSGERQYVENDIRAVAQAAHQGGAILKVILETSLLNREEKVLACELSLAAGADFVKTSTGLVGGATAEDVMLMRSVVGERIGVKASGGIRSAADMRNMVSAGANRIGTSAGVKIAAELGAP